MSYTPSVSRNGQPSKLFLFFFYYYIFADVVVVAIQEGYNSRYAATSFPISLLSHFTKVSGSLNHVQSSAHLTLHSDR